MRIIDCDSHCIFPDIFDNVAPEVANRVPKLKFDIESRLVDVIYDKDPLVIPTPAPASAHNDLPGLCSPQDRIKNLNVMKVDLQLISPQERAMRFDYSVEKHLAASMAHSYNISLKKVIDQYPDKFFGAPLVPLQDMDLALAELDWIIANGFKLVYTDYLHWDTTINKGVAHSLNPRMDEFYKKCEDNNIVLYLHFFMNHNIKFESTNKVQQISNNEEINMWEMAFFDLLSDDVFDKYPKLQVVVAEVIQRSMGKILRILNTAYENNKELFKGTQHPIQYIKKHIFFTIDIEQKESFNILMQYVGSDRLLFSTDYPHIDPSGMNKWKDTDDLLESGLSQEDLENIAYRNAEKLFRL